MTNWQIFCRTQVWRRRTHIWTSVTNELTCNIRTHKSASAGQQYECASVLCRMLNMKDPKKYFYFFMTFLLFWVFFYFAFESWDKFKAARVSTNVREQKLLHLQYPSVTVCPEKTFKTAQKIPTSGSFAAARQFYLDNVRSLQEMFDQTST